MASVIAGAILAVSTPKQALASNPNLINFQGKVTNANGVNVTSGCSNYNFDFVLYDDPTLGTPSDGVHDKWHELTKSVSVCNGVFQTELGSATALPNFNTYPALYLAIRFNSDAAGYMSPRIHLDSVPYALNSDALGGLSSGNFVQLAQGVQNDSSSTQSAIFINKNNVSGSPNIIQLQKSNSDVFVLNNSGALSITPVGTTGTSLSDVTITTAADTNIANAIKTGLVINSGAITQNTAATTGTYIGADIANPALVLTTGTALNVSGIRITTGSQTQTAGNLTQNGLSLDIGGNINSGTFNGLKLSASSARTITAGAVVTGLKLDLNTNFTADGVTLTGLSIATPADANIANATKKGLVISSGALNQGSAGGSTYVGLDLAMPTITTSGAGWIDLYGLKVTSSTAATVNGAHSEVGLLLDASATTVGAFNMYSYNGVQLNLPTLDGSFASTFNGLRIGASSAKTISGTSGTFNGINVDLSSAITATGASLTGISIATPVDTAIAASTKTGLKISAGALTQTSASTGIYNGISLLSPGAISTATAAGTLNWNGANIATPAATNGFSGASLTANGLSVTVGTLTATNAGGTTNGINIAGGAITGNSAAAGTTNGITLTTAALTLTTATTQTINGLRLATAGALQTTTAAGTINYAGLSIATPNVTENVASSTINSNGALFTMGSATLTTGNAMTANGIKIIPGNLTQSSGTLTENGLFIDPNATTFTTGGTLNAINISIPNTGSGIFRGINISSAGSRTVSNSFIGLNMDLANLTASSGLTGLVISTPNATSIGSATASNISLLAGGVIQNTTSTGTYNGIVLGTASGITTSAAGVLNWNAASFLVAGATANSLGSTINANGLKIVTGNVTQTAGTLIENGLNVDTSAGTLTSGTLNGLIIGNVTDPGAGFTSNAITLGTGWDKQINGTGWSVDGTGNISVASCTGCGGSLSAAYTAGSAGDQVISLTTANDSLIIRNPSSGGSNSGTTPLYIDQLATGTQGGMTVNLAADSNIANNTRTGLAITSGAVTENTPANDGLYTGLKITNPALTLTSGNSLTADGINVALGTTSSGVKQNGIYVDSSTWSGGLNDFVKGININLGDIASGFANYTGFYIGTNGTARSISTSNFKGAVIDLSTLFTSTGKPITGLSVLIGDDTAIGSAAKTIINIAAGTITQSTASNGTFNGLLLGTPGSISSNAAGTLDWNGAALTVANATTTTAGSAINANGLKITTGTLSQAASTTLIENGIALDLSNSTLTTGGTLTGLKLTAMSTEPSVGTTVGINIGSITTGGQAGSSTAFQIGGGWDYGLVFNDATPDIKIAAATDNTGVLTIWDNCSSSCLNAGTTPNGLLDLKDLSTNFGAAVTSGAFISRNSYFGEEFNVATKNNGVDCTITGSTTATELGWARGDQGSHNTATACTGGTSANFGTGELNFSGKLSGTGAQCIAASQNVVNGAERLSAIGKNASGAGNATCVETLAATGSTSNKIYAAANLPVFVAKVETSSVPAADNNARVYVGMSAGNTATGSGVGMPGDGIFFTNCSTYSQTAPTGCSNTTWYGMTSSGNAQIGTTMTCTGTTSSSKFSYLRFEVRKTGASAGEVHFYADIDTSNGIVETECGSGISGVTLTAAAMAPWLQSVYNGSTVTTTQMDIDYIRSWQDDNVPSAATEPSYDSTAVAPDGSQLVGSPPLTNDLSGSSFVDFSTLTSEDVVANKDLYVHGTLYVDKIKANQIEGLEVITDKISGLSAKLAQTNQQTSTNNNGLSTASNQAKIAMDDVSFKSATITLDLNVMGSLFANGSLVVVGPSNFKGDVNFGAHVSTDGDQPQLMLGLAAGLTLDTPNVASGSVDGNDISGQLTINAGDSAAAGNIVTVKFNKAYGKTPRVILTAANDVAANTHYYVQAAKDGFKVISTDPLTAGTTLLFNYWVNQ